MDDKANGDDDRGDGGTQPSPSKEIAGEGNDIMTIKEAEEANEPSVPIDEAGEVGDEEI
jgi:hypothetical protein